MRPHVIVDTNVLSIFSAQRWEEVLPVLYGAPLLVPSSGLDELGDPTSPNGAGRALAASPPAWMEVRDPKFVDQVMAYGEFPRVRSRERDVADVHIVSLTEELARDGTGVLILSDDGDIRDYFADNPTAGGSVIKVANIADILIAAHVQGLMQAPSKSLATLREKRYTLGSEAMDQVADFERAHNSRTTANQSPPPPIQPLVPAATRPEVVNGEEPHHAGFHTNRDSDPESSPKPAGQALVVRPIRTAQQRLDFQQKGLPFMLQNEGFQSINGISRQELVAMLQDALAQHKEEPKAMALVHERVDAAYAERRAELEAQQWRERERQELDRRHRSRDRKPSLDRDIG